MPPTNGKQQTQTAVVQSISSGMNGSHNLPNSTKKNASMGNKRISINNVLDEFGIRLLKTLPTDPANFLAIAKGSAGCLKRERNELAGTSGTEGHASTAAEGEYVMPGQRWGQERGAGRCGGQRGRPPLAGLALRPERPAAGKCVERGPTVGCPCPFGEKVFWVPTLRDAAPNKSKKIRNTHQEKDTAACPGGEPDVLQLLQKTMHIHKELHFVPNHYEQESKAASKKVACA